MDKEQKLQLIDRFNEYLNESYEVYGHINIASAVDALRTVLFEESFSAKVIGLQEEESNLDNPHFDGAAVEKQDNPRLTKGIFRVFDFMMDGKYHTTAEIAVGAGVPENSASAHYRSLRKKRWGGHTIERIRVTDSGLFKYRLIPNRDSMTFALYMQDKPNPQPQKCLYCETEALANGLCATCLPF